MKTYLQGLQEHISNDSYRPSAPHMHTPSVFGILLREEHRTSTLCIAGPDRLAFDHWRLRPEGLRPKSELDVLCDVAGWLADGKYSHA